MKFRRKILAQMQEWKDSGMNKKRALLIKGLRQVGKTFIVREFAEVNYDSIIYIDFRADKDLKRIFDGDFDIDRITLELSAYRDVSFIPGRTVIIMDEVQDCINARSSVKYFVLDGRYDVIETGSLLGIKGYNRKVSRGIPVGFEHILRMVPMDFEEFLWARGVRAEVLEHIRRSFAERKDVGGPINDIMTRYLRDYICVGGMPSAVTALIEMNSFSAVLDVQRDLLEQLRDDFGKYVDENGDILVDTRLKARINTVCGSIPAQLAKEYKKFQYSKLQKGARSDEYRDAIQWLEDAGLVIICYNLKLLDAPLEGNKDPDEFKMYMSDVGLLTAMFEDGTVKDIIEGNLGIYKGAIYEQFAADLLHKMGRSPYYYHRDSKMEVDFIIRYGGKVSLLEVKAKDGRAKAARTILEHHDIYKVDRCIKLKESGIGDNGGILTIPQYMAYLLAEDHRV